MKVTIQACSCVYFFIYTFISNVYSEKDNHVRVLRAVTDILQTTDVGHFNV